VGSGFRTFTAGEVLTASNVQNYLMDQSVMVFGGSAARSSAIGTANFEEGMVSYLTDTDKVEAYNGTNWVSVAPTTSQGLTLINTTSFSAVASQSINDVFSTTYDYYKILMTYVCSTGDNELRIRYRVSGADNSNSVYDNQRILGENTTIAAQQETAQTSNRFAIQSTIQSVAEGIIYNPFKTARTYHNTTSSFPNSAGNPRLALYAGVHEEDTSFTGFTLISSSGTTTGTISVFGFNK
jgi:hypothetical protein